ncbi:SDR family NAD(P)-dependent oxidoreductase [Pigmentiphaga litoralis]|uniref:NAD(P)-dependent dehydrogenase (Short-subunit alcohol dehydrogenase family) n=1 Tax=Pigmentiphaga litoralis TaxID=516702 RepID=A0A7Y9IUK9_9BURK|nr:NAD(P)-dependent dehydrogenase (short-subunit alcohol dehydrogenase family) [Pigmentiphaga litoralis]NYE83331.1 NAD(P)-dependent dehydrogenase (short-subunit alcohol dehydrogenase family) [Pigmentiphaga litoralis]
MTGGARGIGAAIARTLVTQGASVTIAGRHADALQAAVNDLEAALPPGAVSAAACPSNDVGLSAGAPSGVPAERSGAASSATNIGYVVMDVADSESVRAAFAQARRRAGVIDILVNNAGQAESAPLARTDDALWRQMMDVNLSGSFFCMRAALPDMVDAGWGRIVNIASTAGLIGYGYTAAYCASKHGVIGLTRSVALEVATKGVTVNAVCPGFTETDLLTDAVDNIVAKTGRDAAQVQRDLASLNPQKRLVKPDEVANAVLWLCMPGSDAMNGQSLAVAGGEVM